MRNLFLFIPFLFILISGCRKEKDEFNSGKSTAVFNSSKIYGKVVDTDGNEYKTIKLGTQTWMAENLRTTHYQNGEAIPNVKAETDQSIWGALTTGAYCSYNNSINADSIATFGLLYNGYAVIDSRNIAPDGWHIPTDADWDTLETFVAEGDAITSIYGNGVAGGRLKEEGPLHWGYSNKADNSSGFTAMPGGQRYTYYDTGMWHSEFQFIGYWGSYWSATSVYSGGLLIRIMVPRFPSITRGQINFSYGVPARCVRDN